MHPRFCIASACAKSDVGKKNSGSMWILMNPHGLHRPTMFHMFQYICHVLYAVLWSCMTVFFEKLFHGLWRDKNHSADLQTRILLHTLDARWCQTSRSHSDLPSPAPGPGPLWAAFWKWPCQLTSSSLDIFRSFWDGTFASDANDFVSSQTHKGLDDYMAQKLASTHGLKQRILPPTPCRPDQQDWTKKHNAIIRSIECIVATMTTLKHTQKPPTPTTTTTMKANNKNKKNQKRTNANYYS